MPFNGVRGMRFLNIFRRIVTLALISFSVCILAFSSYASPSSSVKIEGFDLTHCNFEFCYKLYAPEAFQGILSPIYVFNSADLKVFKKKKDMSLELIRTERGLDGGYFNPDTSKIVLRNIAGPKVKDKMQVHDAILYMNNHRLMYY